MALTVSIITPSFNQGKYIVRTIKSVLDQNISPLEYIVVDGGSTDTTVEILESYSTQLRYVSESDRGQAHAVNKGLIKTSGEIIGWLNSDDIYYPGAIQKVLAFFSLHPEIDVVYGKANHIDQEDGFLASYPTETWNFNRLKQTCFIAQPAVFFRRRVLERSGMLNEKLYYCLDYEYWLRLASAGLQFAYLPDLLAGSRLYPETKTMSDPLKAQREAIGMLSQRLGYVPEGWLLQDAIDLIKRKTSLKMPMRRYIIAIYFAGLFTAFRRNGLLKGLRSSLYLPKAMLTLHRERNRA